MRQTKAPGHSEGEVCGCDKERMQRANPWLGEGGGFDAVCTQVAMLAAHIKAQWCE